MKIEDIARITHEVNRIYCAALRDLSQVPWSQAPGWQKESAVNGVLFHLDNPEASAADSHENWMRHKIDEGWSYGEEKDPAKKKHPWLIPFDDLPRAQRYKNHLFRDLVHMLSEYLDFDENS